MEQEERPRKIPEREYSSVVLQTRRSRKDTIDTIELITPDVEDTFIVFTQTQQNSIASILSGIGSGTLSSIICAPLDLVRTRMQVMGDLHRKSNEINVSKESKFQSRPSVGLIQSLRDIVKADGLRGCFRGLSSTLMTVPSFWGIYFPLYEHMKKDLNYRVDHMNLAEDQDKEAVKHMVHMGSAIGAGAIADFFCNPMFVVRTRMQTEALHYMEVPRSERKPHGILQTIKGLYAEGGILVFWRGFTASLLGLTHVGIQFPVYEYLKAKAREKSPDGEESVLDLLLASGASKMVATSTTYPHEVIRSRVMDYRGHDRSKMGLVSTFKRIINTEGYLALYTGLHVSLIRVIPNCCITFMSYEMILRWSKSVINRNSHK